MSPFLFKVSYQKLHGLAYYEMASGCCTSLLDIFYLPVLFTYFFYFFFLIFKKDLGLIRFIYCYSFNF